jgi:urea transport system permease protein
VKRQIGRLLFAAALLALMVGRAAAALTPAQALAIAQGDSDDRIAALDAAVASGDSDLAVFVQALLDDEVKVAGGRVLRVTATDARDAATGEVVPLPEGAEDVVNNNRVRGALQIALAASQLASPDATLRAAAVAAMARSSLDEGQLPLIDKALAAESDPALHDVLERMKATIQIGSSDRAVRLAAARSLGASQQPAVASLLQERLAAGAEEDQEVRAALTSALASVKSRLAWGENLGVLFTGISLGSIRLILLVSLF